MTDDYILKEKHKQYLKEFKYKQNKGAYRKKDSERQKTYNAESVYRKAMNVPLTYKNLEAYKESAEELHNKIVNSKTWAKHTKYPHIVPYATFSSRLGGANADQHRVKYGSSRSAATVIHELSHSIGNLHHGRSFRQSQVMLTGRFLGAEHKKALMKAYKEAGLSYGKERKPKSYEQWVKSYKHMQKIKQLPKKENNMKADKFVKLANKRVNRVFKQLQLIGNLSNRCHYDYTQDEVKQILKAIEKEIASVKERFSEAKRHSDKTPFKLD
jgi:hypothetical protein